MIGIYEKQENIPTWVFQKIQQSSKKADGSELGLHLVYKNSLSGWYMVMTSLEWLIVDSKGESKFRHAGETILPGCCERWTKLGAEEAEGVVLRDESAPETNKDPTLPWQVIMIGSEDQVQEFHQRAHHRSFRMRQKPAIGCSTCEPQDVPAEPAEDTIAAWSAEVD